LIAAQFKTNSQARFTARGVPNLQERDPAPPPGRRWHKFRYEEQIAREWCEENDVPFG